ncbi:MAG TPA: PilZ domain-containing protein [Thermodesulfovibrionales bacterium]|nr:PilZ domain-containing protein [Thermodesulfovibrionales bacterium]
MNETTEKRGSLRCPVNLFVMGCFRNNLFSSTARDISTSGMLFETNRPLTIHDRITFSFVLQHKISIDGEVVRASRKTSDVYDYGVRFLDVDPGSKAEIDMLVRNRIRR